MKWPYKLVVKNQPMWLLAIKKTIKEGRVIADYVQIHTFIVFNEQKIIICLLCQLTLNVMTLIFCGSFFYPICEGPHWPSGLASLVPNHRLSPLWV